MKKYFLLLVSILLFLPTKSFAQKRISIKKERSKLDATVVENAVLASGKLIRVDSFPSKNIEPRPVDVWLPENYSSEKKYAVLYMHDGQNLFDATTTWNKQEWMVDEVATKLIKEKTTKDFIVVGIHNIPAIRFLDLYPQKSFNYLAEKQLDSIKKSAIKNGITLESFSGDAYLKFIVNELKPYIDKTYSVKTDRENTAIAGSSMGGLMSWYAISEYPKIFGAAACLSTHWVGLTPSPNNPLPAAIFKYLEKNAPEAKSHKLYFDYGNKTLDQHYPQYAPRVDEIFKAKGYTYKNVKNLFFEGTDHSENSWNKRLDQPLIFLLGK
jgi:predicted alpha/beta superfamily hydrolase